MYLTNREGFFISISMLIGIALICLVYYLKLPTPLTPLSKLSKVILHCKDAQVTFLNVHEFVTSYESQYRDIEQVCQEALEHEHIYGDRIQIIY